MKIPKPPHHPFNYYQRLATWVVLSILIADKVGAYFQYSFIGLIITLLTCGSAAILIMSDFTSYGKTGETKEKQK